MKRILGLADNGFADPEFNDISKLTNCKLARIVQSSLVRALSSREGIVDYNIYCILAEDLKEPIGLISADPQLCSQILEDLKNDAEDTDRSK
jgi:hypothetical protein